MTAAIEQGMAAGQHLGAQVYVWFDGNEAANFALGQLRPGVAMEEQSRCLWMSATKPLTAVALAGLWEKGQLSFDDPVSAHIPEFGQKGKEHITLRHVLTHTGGFRSGLDLNWDGLSWAEALAKVNSSRLERGWEPGKKAAYHPASGWYILGEILRRLSQMDFGQYIKRTIFDPLGMEFSSIGLGPDAGESLGHSLGVLYDTTRGDQAVALRGEDLVGKGSPGAGGLGPMAELGRFYRMLLEGGQWAGQRLLAPATVATLTQRHRQGLFDHTFKHIIDWGLGFVLSSNQYGEDTVPYGYGRYASWRTFGHSGRQSSVAFADPEVGLVAALAVNGMPGEEQHRYRFKGLCEALYQDLELAA